MKLGILATHPIQYQAPLFRALANELDVKVYFAHQQTSQGQAEAGFGVAFEWDVPLLDGYEYEYLRNLARKPNVSTFAGCDTPEIGEIIRKEEFDAFMVTGWYNKSYLQALWACKRTGTPIMVRGDSQLATKRNVGKRAAQMLVYKRFLRLYDAYLVVGRRSNEYYLRYGASPHRMFFVPHFVDNMFFSAKAEMLRPRRSAIRERLGLDERDLVLLFIGKFIEKKRPLDVIEAASILRRDGTRAVPVFVGDGALKPIIRRTAAALNVPIVMAGFKNQSELPEMYVAGDILVLPSDGGETWGLVVNEAMASGTPAVVSDKVGCGPDLIDENGTGATFEMGCPNMMVEAISRVRSFAQAQCVRSILRKKMRIYSLENAVCGILEAVSHVKRRTT